MGTPCSLKWREAGERERVWAINRGHPIAQGLGECVEIAETEMYGEPFAVPEPMETVFVSWYEGGEVFRSGMTWQRGAGRIFYFSPGHETYPIYHNEGVRQVLRNAVHWAHNPAPAWTAITEAPNVPVGKAKEKIVQKGARLHADGDKGLRLRSTMHELLLLGTGGIAGHHVEEFAGDPGMRDRRLRRSRARPRRGIRGGKRHRASISRAWTTAIAWGKFDAAINATPDGVHKATTLALIAAGKHVFCEKPLAPSYPDALAMTEAAEAAGLVNMVNLTYRNSPALQQARKMVEAGEIGELRHVEAAYRQSWLVGKAWGDWRDRGQWLWRLSTAHGSTGVLGDVGIHILDFASFGAADDIVSLKADLVTFPKAEGDRIGDYVLDANDSVAHDRAAEIRRAGDGRGDALRHRPRQRPVAVAARHQGRAEGRDRRQEVAAVGLPRQGHRQGTAGRSSRRRRSGAMRGALPMR